VPLFLKKAAKNFCLLWGEASGTAMGQRNQKFFAALFFKKATACFSLWRQAAALT
jgi:hypothetical protein